MISAVEDEAGRTFEAFSTTFTTLPDGVPAVLSSIPADGEFNVSVYDTPAITSDISGVGGGVDPATLTDEQL